MIEIENNLQRSIWFRLGNLFYMVDPNRILSKEGIKNLLEKLGKSSSKSIDEAFNFG